MSGALATLAMVAADTASRSLVRRARHALVPGSIGVVLAGLVGSELWLGPVRAFWIGHPLTTALVASAVTLAATVLVVDAVVRRRSARRWKVVAEAAYRELSTDAYAFFVDLLRFLRLSWEERRFHDQVHPILSPRFHARMDRQLAKRRGRSALSRLIYDHTERLGRSIARWSPVMLQTEELADALVTFAHMRDTLITANRGFDAVDADPNWLWGFWTSLDYFFLLFSHFDGLRRRALGDPLLLGDSEAEYRRAWGLPERDAPDA